MKKKKSKDKKEVKKKQFESSSTFILSMQINTLVLAQTAKHKLGKQNLKSSFLLLLPIPACPAQQTSLPTPTQL